MNPASSYASVCTAVLLALAAIVAMWATARRRGSWTNPTVIAQPIAAVLFYLMLFPPQVSEPANVLTVITPGATAPQVRSLSFGVQVVALPDVQAPATIERVPDLATALREHPAITDLDIIGDGLPARDREFVGERGLQFEPAPAQGLTDLQMPSFVRVGAQWVLSGRVATAGLHLELRDPSGAIVDTATPADDGRFKLSGLARAAGPVTFVLSLLDTKQTVIDSAAVPIVVQGGEPLNVILRVGTPDPEFKYWRRWAADAGLHLSVAAGLSDGIALRDGDTQLTPQTLEQTDLVILDERAWTLLTADEKSALKTAVQNGLGLLLRVNGPVAQNTASEWSELGYRVSPADQKSVTLDHRLGLHERAAFTTAPVSIEAPGATPMLAADDDTVLAWWRAQGRGRVGLWSLVDSYRLVLSGEAARYGTLWSGALARLARAHGSAIAQPKIPGNAWVDERASLCGLGASAEVVAPDGTTTPLIVDTQACAGDWPATPGWQLLQSAALSTPFYVRAADDARTLRQSLNRAATQRLVRNAPQSKTGTTARFIALPRWPFFIVWLLMASFIWWRERSA